MPRAWYLYSFFNTPYDMIYYIGGKQCKKRERSKNYGIADIVKSSSKEWHIDINKHNHKQPHESRRKLLSAFGIFKQEERDACKYKYFGQPYKHES